MQDANYQRIRLKSGIRWDSLSDATFKDEVAGPAPALNNNAQTPQPAADEHARPEDTAGPLGRALHPPIPPGLTIPVDQTDWEIASAQYHTLTKTMKYPSLEEKFGALTKSNLEALLKSPPCDIILGQGEVARVLCTSFPKELFLHACPQADRYLVEAQEPGKKDALKFPGDIDSLFLCELIGDMLNGHHQPFRFDPPRDLSTGTTVREIIAKFRLFVYLNLFSEASKWDAALTQYISELPLPLVTSEVAMIWHSFQYTATPVQIMLAHLAMSHVRNELMDREELLDYARRHPFLLMELQAAVAKAKQEPLNFLSRADHWKVERKADHGYKYKPPTAKKTSTTEQTSAKQTGQATDTGKGTKASSRSVKLDPADSSFTPIRNRQSKPWWSWMGASRASPTSKLDPVHSEQIPLRMSEKNSHTTDEVKSQAQKSHDARVKDRFDKIARQTHERKRSGLDGSNQMVIGMGISGLELNDLQPVQAQPGDEKESREELGGILGPNSEALPEQEGENKEPKPE